MGKRAQAQQQPPRDALTLYLHEASRERLATLSGVLNISRTAVVAQAISRWIPQGPVVGWHVEEPFGVRRGRRGATFRMCARLPAGVGAQVEALADTLHVSLSAVVEQALLRWCREDPLVKQSNGQAEQAAEAQ